jgi:C-terminal processing protease CtpA/Prc
VEHLWTSAHVDGPRYGATRPVTILTSHSTFSAAEDFAYAMQAAHRATVIGEATRGGAHPTERFRVGRHFVANIPVSRSISAFTHANWEGKGVQPDLLVPAASARRVAAERLRQSPAPPIGGRAAG